jgi:antitoxin component HigA of HigAB toxin-antitoxin module
MMRVDIRPLRTDADYDWALAEIEAYFLRERRPAHRRPTASTCSLP